MNAARTTFGTWSRINQFDGANAAYFDLEFFGEATAVSSYTWIDNNVDGFVDRLELNLTYHVLDRYFR